MKTIIFVTVFMYACTQSPKKMPAITYPETKQIDVVEKPFGQTITDPYRWLEDELGSNKDVASWVESQNKVSNAYLNQLPGRDIFKGRLKELNSYERISIPVKKGGRYFYFRTLGTQNQRVMYVRKTEDGKETVLIDPNTWSKDGTTSLSAWAASDDGTRLAYAVQDGGSDWLTIRIIDVNTGKLMDDEVKWARFTTIDWAKDGAGFFYLRYPEPKLGVASQASIENQAIYFHTLGMPQANDRLVYATPEQPILMHSFTLSSDKRYLSIISSPGSLGTELIVVDLNSTDWKPRKLINNFNSQWIVIGNVGTKFFLNTTKDAPRSKVVTMDIAEQKPVVRDLVPEQTAVLSTATFVGGRLLLSYQVDVKTEIRRYTPDGKADGIVKLPDIGTAVGFEGGQNDKETFFGFTSFNVAGIIYRYNIENNTSKVWYEAKPSIDLKRISVEQQFYKSKDGTRVPIYIIRRKDITSPAPTILYAYGGFAITELPSFSTEKLAWVEQGGVFAMAHIRGGAEYGKAWHDAGRRFNKQNGFDDFIAAGEYLKAQGITSQNGLAIQGASNGGLLVGAVVNQRPDLFAAALAQVGVMDMLRFDKFTVGKLWEDEYGSPSKEADFRNLLKYSPYHNIKSGKTYPAILATTAELDNKVIPAHTFKYVAALQATDIGSKPHIIRIETRAGHGGGKPLDKTIAENADMWAFAAHWTGLKVKMIK